MPYEFQVEAWQDFDGNRYVGTPSDLAETYGVLVHVVSTDDPTDQTYFWAYSLGTFQDWAEWWTYISALMEMHGMELAQ